ncbi:MAG TPA: alternative ribosome rescue aminoacyl-tRNA hydrolase ArfB [Armatimonadota bacterium]
MLFVTPSLSIPRAELSFRTSRSGGPGGQHVNKVETRVELLFDVANSPSMSVAQRARLLASLRTWLDSEGVMHLVADSYRSQYRNREEVVERFVTLLARALQPQKARKATRVPRGAREQRLEEKKTRSHVKRLRGRGRGDED